MMRTSQLILAFVAGVVQAEESCSPLHLIYARATGEPPGSISAVAGTPNYRSTFDEAASKVPTKGFGAAGWALASELTKAIPGTTSYPVHYSSSIDLVPSIGNGTADMINEMSTKSKACPNTKYVLAGHSQGAALVYLGIPGIEKGLLDKVAAVTLFGAPPCREVVKERCMSYCNVGDMMCEGDGIFKSAGGWSTLERLANGSMTTMQLIPQLGSGILKGLLGVGFKPSSILNPGSGKRNLVVREAGEAEPDACAENVPEKGHKPGVQGNGHIVYAADMYYIKAAVCFIQKVVKK